MKISKKLYSELYDYFWNRADLKECSVLKGLFYSQPKTGKAMTRAQVFKQVSQEKGL